jgi:hypothetical protein
MTLIVKGKEFTLEVLQEEGWHRVRASDRFANTTPREQWCWEQFKWNEWIRFGYGEYWFLHERDAVLFALRWL